MVLDQIKDREATVSYPNEDAEELIDIGYSLWHREIDPKNLLIVSRKYMDDWLCKEQIVGDFKEVNRFMAGVLSGTVVRRQDDVKKSQFMKLILKGILRDCVKNILAFNKLGIDSKIVNLNKESDGASTVPFSH